MEIQTYSREHLDPIIRMCEGISFATSLSDPDRADRAMSAPGAVALVALEDGGLVGFSHSITDGALQAYLSMLLVSPDHQRRGIASALMVGCGAIRLDLVSSEEPSRSTGPSRSGGSPATASKSVASRVRSSTDHRWSRSFERRRHRVGPSSPRPGRCGVLDQDEGTQ